MLKIKESKYIGHLKLKLVQSAKVQRPRLLQMTLDKVISEYYRRVSFNWITISPNR